MKSLQGHFLVAAPHQLDPNFIEAVILIVGHTHQGAFGVALNGVSQNCRRVYRHGARRRSGGKISFSVGGPVAGPLMAVHADASLGEQQFLPGLFFSAKRKNLFALMWQCVQPCRIFVGYTGWGPGQLDYEVERGVWRVLPATVAQIFSEDAELWKKLAWQANRMQLRAMFNITYVPADPRLN